MFSTPIKRLKQFMLVLLFMFIILYAVDPSAIGTVASGVGSLAVAIIGGFKTVFVDIYHSVFGNGNTPSVHL